MEKFMYLFRGGMSQVDQSPEAMQKETQKWVAWMQSLGQAGALVGGEPLEAEGKTVSGLKKIVTDGVFMESKEMIGGYLIVNAKDMDQAVELSMGCPILDTPGNIEIRKVKKLEM
jgi:hypothetical protein